MGPTEPIDNDQARNDLEVTIRNKVRAGICCNLGCRNKATRKRAASCWSYGSTSCDDISCREHACPSCGLIEEE